MDSCDGCAYKGGEDCPLTIDLRGSWACVNGRLSDNRCVACGEIIPEGRQVCLKCERDAEEKTSRR